MNTGFLAYELLKKGVDLPIVDPSLFSRELMAKASDLVGDEEVTSVRLMEGDTIVMGSDGLFDNVFNHEIISTMAQYSDVAEAAKALANLAHNHSTDSSFDSPYSSEARTKGYDVPWWKKFIGMKLTGGKLDDITVIVGQVVNERDI